jgi:hypothetical protein
VVSTCQVVSQYLLTSLGLGQYLEEIDPDKHDSTWQLQHIIMFCRVHFQRNILKAIGSRNKGSPLWSRMMELLSCQSEAHYDELVDLFISITACQVANDCLLTTY